MSGPNAKIGAGAGSAFVPSGRYKRPFDLAVLIVIALALAPFWLLLCIVIPLAIWREDRGTVIHVQRRVGQHGQPFDIIKFRTMVEDAERLTGPVLAMKRDSRSTRVGAWLRRFHLDEIPQFINVAKGDMSLVGPRPERPELVAQITCDVPEFTERLSVPPGIAGLAQAQGSYHLSPRSKLRYDRLYIASMSPWLDLKLLAMCLWKVVKAVYRHG